ncbi:MAG: alpha/beta hydrolase [Bacteroidota bacterium]
MRTLSLLKWIKLLLKWLTIIVFSLIALLLIAIEIFDRYVSSEKGTHWLYSEIPDYQPTIHFTDSGVRYLSIGEADKPALLLVHGAPGSVMDWVAFAKRQRIYEHYRLLIADRPGYGGTKPRGANRSIKNQAERLLEIIQSEQEPVVVLGHSYGGPIAVAMGALQPEKVKYVIGAAGQYDPDNEVTFGISYWINFKLFKYLLPRMIWVSNIEKLTHPDALREVMELFKTISVPVYLIHGDIDTLVPYENSTFLMNIMESEAEITTLEGVEHPFHMQETDLLVDYTIDLFNKTAKH